MGAIIRSEQYRALDFRNHSSDSDLCMVILNTTSRESSRENSRDEWKISSSGAVQFEMWSLLSIFQPLLAHDFTVGANFPFIPAANKR
jgi:hypothetical protein